MLSDSRTFKQRDSGASERRPVGGSPSSSSPDVISERVGTDVSSYQATPPPLDVSTHAIPVTSSVVLPPPLSDFSLLGSSHTSESFPLFHVLRIFSGLSLGQLNHFALRFSGLVCWAFTSRY